MKIRSILAAACFLASTFAAPNYLSSPEKREPEPLPVRVPNPSKYTRPNGKRPVSKYFQEPGGDEEMGHYDARFFKGLVPYEERGDALYHLIRSYLTVFRERNVETWIAHGTLLGWWWNGKIMPWDWDLDVQVNVASLEWMAANLNTTMHNYTSTGPGGEVVNRQYMVDVNPNFHDRVRGDGMNVIDARWIDIRNGLFVDITGLAETNPTVQPGVWSCKNFHRYRTRDIYPLRETVFEGVPALVPYSFDRILSEEYSARALTKTMHLGHKWDPEKKEWIKQENMRLGSSKSSSTVHGGTSVAHTPRSLLDYGTDSSQSGFTKLKKLL